MTFFFRHKSNFSVGDKAQCVLQSGEGVEVGTERISSGDTRRDGIYFCSRSGGGG